MECLDIPTVTKACYGPRTNRWNPYRVYKLYNHKNVVEIFNRIVMTIKIYCVFLFVRDQYGENKYNNRYNVTNKLYLFYTYVSIIREN